jgi:hypothetical protein
MAKAVVTQERVFEVAQALTDQGTAPTILNVQEGIGGGSYTTVKRYLDQWREAAPKQRQPVELPEPAVARLMSLGREFWGLLDEQAGQQVEALRAATREEVAAIQTQLDQAEQAIGRLEAETRAGRQPCRRAGTSTTRSRGSTGGADRTDGRRRGEGRRTGGTGRGPQGRTGAGPCATDGRTRSGDGGTRRSPGRCGGSCAVAGRADGT